MDAEAWRLRGRVSAEAEAAYLYLGRFFRILLCNVGHSNLSQVGTR